MSGNPPPASSFFQNLYYISFSAFALAGFGYFAWKIYKESQQEEEQKKRDKKMEKPKDLTDSEPEEKPVRGKKRQRAEPESEDEDEMIKQSLRRNKDSSINRSDKPNPPKHNPEREHFIEILIDMMKMNGSDIIAIKKKNRIKRRSVKDKKEYRVIVEELHSKVDQILEENSEFVLKKHNMSRERFEELLERYKYKDEEITNLFNSLPTAEMYASCDRAKTFHLKA